MKYDKTLRKHQCDQRQKGSRKSQEIKINETETELKKNRRKKIRNRKRDECKTHYFMYTTYFETKCIHIPTTPQTHKHCFFVCIISILFKYSKTDFVSFITCEFSCRIFYIKTF